MTNGLAVLVAAIANMVIGFLWYGPLFGKQWTKLMNFDSKKMKEMKNQSMTKPMILGFISALVMAYALSYILDRSRLIFNLLELGALDILHGLFIGFLVWLGFIVTVLLGTVLWEGKPIRLYLLNISYWLVTLLVMGAILAVWF